MSLHHLDVFVVIPILYKLIADFAAFILTHAILEQISRQHNITFLRLIITVVLSSALLLSLSYVFPKIATTLADDIIRAVSPELPNVSGQPSSIMSNIFDLASVLLFQFHKNRQEQWNIGTLYWSYSNASHPKALSHRRRPVPIARWIPAFAGKATYGAIGDKR